MGIEETIQRLESRVKDNPKSILFARLADLYLKRGEIDRAVELCEEGIQNHPSYVTGNYILGKAYIAKGLHDRAEIEFKKVLSHDRQFLSAHKHLGDIMARMGWENKAAIHYRDILRIDPMDDYAHQMLDTISPGETMLKDPEPDQESGKEALPRFETEPPEKEAKDWNSELDDVFSIEETEIGDVNLDNASDAKEPETTIAPQEITDDGGSEATTVSEDGFRSEDEGNGILSETEEIIIVPPAEDMDTDITSTEETGKLEDEQPKTEYHPPIGGSKPSVGDQESTGLLDAELEAIFPEQSADAEPVKSVELPAAENVQPTTDQDAIDIDKESSKKTSLVSGDKILDSILEEDLNLSEKQESKTVQSNDKIPLSFDSEAEETDSTPIKKNLDESDSVPLAFGEKDDSESPVPPDTPKEPLIVDVPDESTSPPPPTADLDDQSNGRIISPTLGEIYAAQGQHSKAIKVYEMLIQKKPDEETKYRQKINELKKKLNP